tara:strand:+ start:72 stop:1601 length:1530 start_codon:yes stop_codon:yes gene_type:complete
MDSTNQPMSSVPQVLVQNGAFDENQDTVLTSIRLEPNASSQIQSNFILPKNGSVLDSNSSLVWSVGWDGYNTTNGKQQPADQLVCLKQFSGGLNSIRRARMYVGGRLLFTNPDVALSVHIHKLSTNPDHFCEVEDMKLGSAHGFNIADDGKVQTQPGVNNQQNRVSKMLTREVGNFSLVPADNMSYECTLLLSDVFPALKHLQIPIKHLKDDMRIEIDWETSFDETMLLACDANNAITNFSVSINNPLLYLDYLTYNEEVEAGLAMASQQGITIPYREISLIQKQLSAITNPASSQDILLGFQGKLLMKLYVSHKFANSVGGSSVRGAAYQRFNGRCRSDMGMNFKYNLIINDLHIHDAKVDTASQQYSFLSMTAENPIFAYPNSMDFNARFNTAKQATDITDATYRLANAEVVSRGPANQTLTDIEARDGIAGTQAFIGFDLSKYGTEGGLNPANAGYRVGSTPIILNIEQDGGANTTRQGAVKQVDVICESIKILQIRNGMVDTTEA